jgi:hypothetical protein
MGPLVTGMLSDNLGVQTALLVSVTALAAAGVILVIGSQYYAADAGRIDKPEAAATESSPPSLRGA